MGPRGLSGAPGPEGARGEPGIAGVGLPGQRGDDGIPGLVFLDFKNDESGSSEYVILCYGKEGIQI